mgnify:CR=1 FL=1
MQRDGTKSKAGSGCAGDVFVGAALQSVSAEQTLLPGKLAPAGGDLFRGPSGQGNNVVPYLNDPAH